MNENKPNHTEKDLAIQPVQHKQTETPWNTSLLFPPFPASALRFWRSFLVTITNLRIRVLIVIARRLPFLLRFLHFILEKDCRLFDQAVKIAIDLLCLLKKLALNCVCWSRLGKFAGNIVTDDDISQGIFNGSRWKSVGCAEPTDCKYDPIRILRLVIRKFGY